MIQRIQSVFLLLAAVTCLGLFYLDIADTEASVANSELFTDASFNLFDDTILIVLFSITAVLFLTSLFWFKNRQIQLTFNRFAISTLIAGIVYGGYLWYSDVAAIEATPDFGVVLPVVSFVFGILGGRYIAKDEKLVRSADRLR